MSSVQSVPKDNKRGIVQQALFAGPSFSPIKMTSASASRKIVPVPMSERRDQDGTGDAQTHPGRCCREGCSSARHQRP